MKYKIGDIAYLLDLSTESLRHYERQGIVHPQKDESSSYRYYSAWDLILLCACRHYRALGFTLEDSAALLEQDARDVLSGLRERERAIEAEIERQTEMLRTIHAWRTEAEASFDLIGRFEIEENVPTVCLPYQQGDRIERDAHRLACIREWLRFIPYVYVGMGIPWKPDGFEMEPCVVALCMAEVAVPILKPQVPDFAVHVPARRCVHTAFLFEQETFNPSASFAPLRSFMEKQGLRASGELLCRFNLTGWSGTSVSGVLDCFLPIE